MYLNFIKSELKKWSRDSMMGFMLIYPFIFGIIGRFFLPWIGDRTDINLDLYADLILVILTLITPITFGSILAFSILEDRDDNIFTSIRISPLSLNQFLSFRFITVLILTYFTVVFIMWFSNIGDFPIKYIFAIALLAALEAPMYGFLINAFSSNKIEGFAVMKGMGIFILFPIIALFFLDKKELFFSFAPGFWAAKCISSVIRGEGILYLSYGQYYFIGLLYLTLLNLLSYKIFTGRVEI